MENIPSHSWLEIDVQSLKHNWETVKSIARHRSRIMAVVKATCYGHGTEVAELLATFGLEDFGVTSAEEGCELKKRGLRGNIYILGGFLPWEAEVLVEEGFIPIVSSLRDIEYLEKASRVKDKRVYFHLKIDTGMGRLGLLWENSNVRILERICRNSFLQMGGVMTHFSSAESDPEYTRWQFEIFSQFLDRFGLRGKNLVFHCCNSAGFLNFPEMHLDMSRIGIALLGVSPNWEADFVRKRDLRPIAQLKAMVKYVKDLPPNFKVGYGGTFTTTRNTRVAIVSIGYAQGIFRNLSNKMEVLIKGKRAKVIGNISMDQLTIDITEIPDVQEGDIVTLIGQDGEEEIRVEDLAKLSGTIPHEILCSLKKIPKRLFIHGNSSSPTQ